MVKQVILSFVCLLLIAPYAQAAEVVFDVHDPASVYAVSSNELKMQVVVKCFSGLNFTGSTKIKRLDLPPGTQTYTMNYYDDSSCLSYKILGIGVNVTANWLNLPSTGPMVFQQSLSFTTQYRGDALNQARQETWSTNSQIVQTTDRGERPTVLFNTNNWSRRLDAGSWLNNGFPSQFDTNILSADVNHISHNDAHKHEDDSGFSWIGETDTYNVNLTGVGVNTDGSSPWSLNNFSVFVGDYNDYNYSILDVAAAHYASFIVSKGQLMLAPYGAFTDTQQNAILQEINDKLNNISTANVVTAINNQSAQQQEIANQQEQAAQQRQEQIMNSNTASGEASIANFMTSFDDGADPSLAGVITKPLEFIQALTTTSCFPLTLPLPFVNSNLTLPCGRSYLANFASPLLALWDVISVGLLSYWIATHLYVMIHEFKNPDNDGNIQPLDL